MAKNPLFLGFSDRRTNCVEPLIGDVEGPLGVDTTFEGLLFVHVLPGLLHVEYPGGPPSDPKGNLTSPEKIDELLATSLERLVSRHPGRAVALYRWNVLARWSRMVKLIRELRTITVYSLMPEAAAQLTF